MPLQVSLPLTRAVRDLIRLSQSRRYYIIPPAGFQAKRPKEELFFEMARCNRPDCKYRIMYRPVDDYYPSCAYCIMTGHTRIGDIMKLYGVNRISPLTHELFDPANCPLYEHGGRKRLPPVALPNSTAEKKPMRSRLLTAAEIARRMEVYNMGLNDIESAKMLGISKYAFSSWRHNYGLKPNVPHIGYRGGRDLKRDRTKEEE